MAVRLRIRQYPILFSVICMNCTEQAIHVTEWVRCFVDPCGMVELRSSASKDLRLLEIWGYCRGEYQDGWLICWHRAVCSISTSVFKRYLPMWLWKQQAPWELYPSTDRPTRHHIPEDCNLGIPFLLVDIILSCEIRFCKVKMWIPVFWIVTPYVLIW
jgi:hypothetical protein